MEGSLLKVMRIKDYNVDLANLLVKKCLFDFAKEMNFDGKALGNKNTGDESIIRLPIMPAMISPVIMAG